jgi:aminoglycoside phosphotransferase (APT) family kinase protein
MWSIYRWLDGTTAAGTVTDWIPIARSLGSFLATLHRIDPFGGPEPGAQLLSRRTSERLRRRNHGRHRRAGYRDQPRCRINCSAAASLAPAT